MPSSYISFNTVKRAITSELKRAGWTIERGVLVPPEYKGKEHIRKGTHAHRVSRAQRDAELVREQGRELMQHFASGKEINPAEFDIVIKRVEKDTIESDLFRFATLFWSIPVSRGYGRRMRYIAFDKSNGKVVGLFALGDPVFNLRARDEAIGWDVAAREERLYHVLDAFALGAVPPYNQLLCGKLMALLAVSNTIRNDFNRKYRANTTIWNERTRNASLVLVTTTSALGRSSVYNRIKLADEQLRAYRSVGFTSGFGHFQVSDDLFMLIRRWLRQRKDPYADGHQYGDGPSWRMRTIRRAVDILQLEGSITKHGVQREVFLAPLAKNYAEYLRGEHATPRYYDRPMDSVVSYFKERWLLPRSERMSDWRNWTSKDGWRIVTSLFDGPL